VRNIGAQLITMLTKRLVFFIGGFDPKGSSSFYQQNKANAAAHDALHGVRYNFGPRTRTSEHSYQWTVQSDQDHASTDTEFEYLAWDDIVRRQWARTPLAITRQALASLVDFASAGTIQQLYRHSKNVVLAALFPYALALGCATLVVLLTLIVAALLRYSTLSHTAQVSLLCGVFAASSWMAFSWLRRVPSTWFLRVVAFSRSYASSPRDDDALEQRITFWSQYIAQKLQTNSTDEVLLIGYSAGSILSTAVLARILNSAPAAIAQRITLVTLGNCIPVPAVLPQAAHLRSNLQTIDRAQARWVDVTSPIDWGSFALTDPVNHFAHGQPSARRKFISPQWHLLFSPQAYQQLKKNKYLVHKQYLQTTELLGTYDYFAIIGGCLGIEERFFQN
jgi:hypothetical protein